MKIGITGAEGRVGQYVVNELLDYEYEVVAITMEPWADSPAENRVADITEYDQLLQAFQGCDAIIHLAGIPHPLRDDETRVFQTNTSGVFNAALAAGNLQIPKLVIASSDCALGITFSHQLTSPAYLPLDEEHPTAPDNCYGMSKLAGEQIAEGMAKRFDMSIVSLRISAVLNTEIYKADWFIHDLHNPERGVTDNLWTYIDVRDCARAFRLAVEADIPGHEIITIASHETRAIVRSEELIARYFPDTELRKPIQGFESFQDCSKAKQLLNFEAKYSWREEE